MYTILISSPTGHRVKSKLIMEDPGSTHNFVMLDLAEKLQILGETTVWWKDKVQSQKKSTRCVYRTCKTENTKWRL